MAKQTVTKNNRRGPSQSLTFFRRRPAPRLYLCSNPFKCYLLNIRAVTGMFKGDCANVSARIKIEVRVKTLDPLPRALSFAW
jgi:hypothetical protein